jgi:hypothetical protein
MLGIVFEIWEERIVYLGSFDHSTCKVMMDGEGSKLKCLKEDSYTPVQI